MKVSVVCPNMANNALGRAMVLAQLAHRLGHDVQIVGSLRHNQAIWPPARSIEPAISLDTFPLSDVWGYPDAARALAARCERGVTIISKPQPTSLGLALLAGLQPRATILDIDDWELGFLIPRGPLPSRVVNTVRDLGRPRRLNTYLGVLAMERIAAIFPHKIASNSWLQARFGGEIIPHVRDAAALDPDLISGDAIRQALRLTDERRWVGFVGTPRAHKGVDVLIDALALLEAPDAPGLVLLGADLDNPIADGIIERALAELGPQRVRTRGHFPFDQLAQHVAAPDIICIPSLRNAASVGQIPAKVFDALAMRRPTIVSDVNDLASVVGDAGVVVPPGDAAALSREIARLDASPELRAQLGAAAGERFKRRFSLDAAMPAMAQLLARASTP